MADVIIRAAGLGKKYLIGREADRNRDATLRDALARSIGDTARAVASALRGRPLIGGAIEEFWALKDVGFDVPRGEILGIIGRNGAGKSTLLKILSRITDPSEGRVEIAGRVASLLEVGTGFHPELSGRENIYLNGAILGMRLAEIRARFDEIVAFAEVEKFVDTPVKRYSSGMYVRLAFAVAAHLDAEILLVDEVLAVGDAAFQRRCLGKIGEICAGGRTVLLVSHNMQSIRQLCGRVMWLDEGRLRATGRPEAVVGQYLAAEQRNTSMAETNAEIARLPPDPAFRLREVDVRQDDRSCVELVSGKPVEIRIVYEVLQNVPGLHVYFQICDMDGSLIFESLHNGEAADHMPLVGRGSYVSTATIPADFLAGRRYELRIQAGIHNSRAIFERPPAVTLTVHSAGLVNRAYPGYETPGKLAPLIRWRTVAGQHAAQATAAT